MDRVPADITAEVFATDDGDAVVVAFGSTVRVVFDVDEALGFASDVALASLVCDGRRRLRRRSPEGVAGGAGSAGPPPAGPADAA